MKERQSRPQGDANPSERDRGIDRTWADMQQRQKPLEPKREEDNDNRALDEQRRLGVGGVHGSAVLGNALRLPLEPLPDHSNDFRVIPLVRPDMKRPEVAVSARPALPVPALPVPAPAAPRPFWLQPHSSWASRDPGLGWTLVGLTYYRPGPPGLMEAYGRGYMSFTDPCLPRSVSSSLLRAGGVKLEAEALSQLFSQVVFTPAMVEAADPVTVSVDNTALEYRGVRYSVPGATKDELATAVWLVFMLKANDIAVSMEIEQGQPRLLHVYKPVLLGQTTLGRAVMAADILLKSFSRARLPALFAKAREHSPKDGAKMFFQADHLDLDIDTETGSVRVTGNNMTVRCTAGSSLFGSGDATVDPRAPQALLCQQLNGDLAALLAQHPDLQTAKRAMSLIMLCKMLYMASCGTTTELLNTWVEAELTPLPPLETAASPLEQWKTGVNTAISGGVTLMSEVLQLERPWRRGNPETDPCVCHRCGWAIESNMPSAVEQGLAVCMPCVRQASLTTWLVKPGPESRAARFQGLIAKFPKEFPGSQYTLAVGPGTTFQEIEAALQEQLPEVPWLRALQGRVSCQAVQGVGTGTLQFRIEHLDSPWPPKPEPGVEQPELPPYYCAQCLWDCRVLGELSIGVSDRGPGALCKLCRLEREQDWFMTKFKGSRNEAAPDNKPAAATFALLQANEPVLKVLLSQRFCVSRQRPQEAMLTMLSQFLGEMGLTVDGFKLKFEFEKTAEHELDITLTLFQ